MIEDELRERIAYRFGWYAYEDMLEPWECPFAYYKEETAYPWRAWMRGYADAEEHDMITGGWQ